MFMHKLGCGLHGRHPDLGRLLVRLSVGLVFVVHGWMKLSNIEMANGFMASLGLPPFMGAVIGVIELIAGLAILVGTHVQIAGLLLAAVMVGAIVLVKGRMGYVGGFEFDLSLLLASLGIAMLGAGRYSVDAKRAGACPGGSCGAVSVEAVCKNGLCAVSETKTEGACCDHQH